LKTATFDHREKSQKTLVLCGNSVVGFEQLEDSFLAERSPARGHNELVDTFAVEICGRWIRPWSIGVDDSFGVRRNKSKRFVHFGKQFSFTSGRNALRPNNER